MIPIFTKSAFQFISVLVLELNATTTATSSAQYKNQPAADYFEDLEIGDSLIK